jgi:hypothetical protein
MASTLDLERMHDSADLAGGVSEIAATAGPDSMVVTAVRTEAGRLRLIAWRINTAGPVTRLGDSGDAAGTASSIDITRTWATAATPPGPPPASTSPGAAPTTWPRAATATGSSS